MIPQRIGPYAVHKRLGTGGVGTVYAATRDAAWKDIPADRLVAIKQVHPGLIELPGLVERLEREAELGQRVEHPNVVRTLGLEQVEEGGQAHTLIVTELVEGQTLRRFMDQHGASPEPLVRHIAREIALGLEAIHTVGAVHRDLKPENLMITPDHQVCIMDLGVARLDSERGRLTSDAEFVGSVAYAAPELIRGGGRAAEARSDLHAIGVVLYELLTGTHPFDAQDMGQLLQAILSEVPQPLRERSAHVSPFFALVVETLMAKDLEARFASAQELAGVLEESESSAWWKGHQLAGTHRPRAARPRHPVPRLVGREEELTRLTDAAHAAWAGQGGLTLLLGEPGIGKSRLVEALLQQEEDAHDTLRIVYTSFAPRALPQGLDVVGAAVLDLLPAVDRSAAVAGHLTDLAGQAPSVVAQLSGGTPPADAAPLAADMLPTVLARLSGALSEQHPLLLVLDDLHHAAAPVHELAAVLAHVAKEHALLVLATADPRSDALLEVLGADHRAQAIHLGRMAPDELDRLIDAVMPVGDLSLDVQEAIARQSDGNPLFALETTRALQQDGRLQRSNTGAWVLEDPDTPVVLPDSIRGLIDQRLNGLDAPSRALLELAACAGHVFDGRQLADILAQPRIRVLQQLAHLERERRLIRAEGATYRFDHHRIREAIYESLADPLREEYHAAIGEYLIARDTPEDGEIRSISPERCVAIAEHLIAAGDTERTLPYFERAREYLIRIPRHEQSLNLMQRALAVEGLLAGTTRLETLFPIIMACDALGHFAAQETWLQEAEELTESLGDPKQRLRYLRGRGHAYWRRGAFDQALACCREGITLAEATGNAGERVSASVNQATLLYEIGRVVEAREAAGVVQQAANEQGNALIESIALGLMSVCQLLAGRFDAGEAAARDELAITTRSNDLEGIALAKVHIAEALRARGHLAEALASVRAARTDYEALGDRNALFSVIDILVPLLVDTGRIEEAEGYLREMDRVLPGPTSAIKMSRRMTLEGEFACAIGDYQRAELSLITAVSTLDRVGHRRGATLAYPRLARAQLELMEDPAQCRETIDDALARLTGMECIAAEVEVRAMACRLDAGRIEDARAALEAYKGRIAKGVLMSAHFDLFQATHDASHRLAAQELLGELLHGLDDEQREKAVRSVPIYRNVMAAD